MTADAPWRRFFRIASLTAAIPVIISFLFVAVIDPWDGLPFSPRLPRVPVTPSTRHAWPMLARDARFDSVVIGTSTSRLLRPELLDRLFDARFVNLSIDAATAYEEIRLLEVFSHSHPTPRFILLGVDANWCDPRPEQRYTVYPFPEWLYQPRRWHGYMQLLNVYALQEAGSQLWAMAGRKPARHRWDGYTDFAIPDSQYDLVRASANILAGGTAFAPDVLEGAIFSTHERLRDALRTMPRSARKVLFFVPFALSYQGGENSLTRAYWAECKRRVVEMAKSTSGTLVVDFMIPSPITSDNSHYYDAIHYRPVIAERIATSLAEVIAGGTEASADYVVLTR